ncbi:hypothetical protein AO1008_01211 [Aspergillus oryzae 100-8]|uniref:Uncharacterized protein n=1 Tax=Aspergillus oryzae (strain 3.042) TaxID=1160506 RepID=I8A5C3_ASPO3|nr:hypothetical protein Ao3042_03700 [Aspergillus oryzae 3.042]KDE85627.1 hypothetical protein AO1008_01211 [Aspergillus oryzae 100-8]|eukprot:EIT79809.1 hypothetical protein Ao3042_03700 [Aspergillus oryzae 3.042]
MFSPKYDTHFIDFQIPEERNQEMTCTLGRYVGAQAAQTRNTPGATRINNAGGALRGRGNGGWGGFPSMKFFSWLFPWSHSIACSAVRSILHDSLWRTAGLSFSSSLDLCGSRNMVRCIEEYCAKLDELERAWEGDKC